MYMSVYGHMDIYICECLSWTIHARTGFYICTRPSTYVHVRIWAYGHVHMWMSIMYCISCIWRFTRKWTCTYVNFSRYTRICTCTYVKCECLSWTIHARTGYRRGFRSVCVSIWMFFHIDMYISTCAHVNVISRYIHVYGHVHMWMSIIYYARAAQATDEASDLCV